MRSSGVDRKAATEAGAGHEPPIPANSHAYHTQIPAKTEIAVGSIGYGGSGLGSISITRSTFPASPCTFLRAYVTRNHARLEFLCRGGQLTICCKDRDFRNQGGGQMQCIKRAERGCSFY